MHKGINKKVENFNNYATRLYLSDFLRKPLVRTIVNTLNLPQGSKGVDIGCGIGRKTPDSVSLAEMIERLRDMETSAMLKRVGIWSESNPDRIAELLAKQRIEEQELKEIQSQVKKAQSPQSLIDLNTATEKELQSIKGIGTVLAERIIAGRPYRTVDDLLKVKGISPKKLEKIRPYFVGGKE